MRPWIISICLAAYVMAQTPSEENRDEKKVRAYSLPDPLTTVSGKKITTPAEWKKVRRPEILRLFEDNMQGRTPSQKIKPRFEVVSTDRSALGGKAIRKQVTISFSGHDDGPKVHMLMYLPAHAKGSSPVFVGLNFNGNHTVTADTAIELGDVWGRDGTKKRATEDTRGRGASQWQVERILARGYGLATAYYGEIEPDFDGGLPYGVRQMFLREGQKEFGPGEWGAVGAWAWGLSRMADYLVSDRDVDPTRIAVMGHSRLGKAALWAGAQDERFAIVISNNSGEGGAALSKRNFGEEVSGLNKNFPHWLSRAYRQYSNKEQDLPFDSHMLLALIAPRPVYVASAADHADPRGEFLACVHAGPVYKLLDKEGLPTDEMPALNQPVMRTIGYHIRDGKHDVTSYDWERYCDFADMHWPRR